MGYNDRTAITFRDMTRRERQHRGWTQTELAHEATRRGAPLGWQAINKIENGSRNVTIAEAVAIANAFGVTVNRLTGMAQRPRADRDFALGRLHESVADAQRAARASIRDITTALGELNELRAGLDEAGLDELAEPIAATEAAMTQIDAAATQLAKAGGEIAEARGRRVAWRAG